MPMVRQLNQVLHVPVAWHVSWFVSVLSRVPLQRTPEHSKCSYSFLFFSPGPFCCQEKMAPLARPSLPPSACGTCHVYPHLSDTDQLPQHQTDRSRVICPAQTRSTWWPSGFFFLHSPQAPFFKLSSFILHCSLSQWGAHHVFVDSHLPYLWRCFKATRQKPTGVGGGKTDSKKKEIQHGLHLVEVHNTKCKTAHWQEQSIFFSFLFFVFPFRIVVNKDCF